jgi:ankyrin repeat protein
MRTLRIAFVVAALLTCGHVGHLTASGSLFDAIRRDDPSAVAAAANGPALDTVDDSGTTPLMYAVLYARPEVVALLLDRGAAVNAANSFGATALMWAAPRTQIVRLLLGRGAAVDAAASDGTTAVVVAARVGNIDAMRALVAARADLSKPATRTNLLTAAFASRRAAAVREYLASVGVTLRSASDLKGPVLARQSGQPAVFEQLLRAGVDPNQQIPLITLSIPTLFVTAREGHLDSLRALLAAGVDPVVTTSRGWTALMMAAADDEPSIAMMRALLSAGVDIDAKDDEGRTALDWAMTRGETEATTFLRTAGAHGSPPPVAPIRAIPPYQPRDAVSRAVAKLQPAGPAFSTRMRCNSCHNQNLPDVAVSAARKRAITIDPGLATHAYDVTQQNWRGRRETALLGDTDLAGFQSNVAYGLFDMAETGAEPTTVTDAMVLALASRQLDDGSWHRPADIRPPLTASTIVSTALALRGLETFAPPGRRSELLARVTRAAAFLRRQVPHDTQDQAFKLLGLVWARASAGEIARERAAVVALQRPDGGWAQLSTLPSDAYATGQALFALRTAGMRTPDLPVRHGVDYLLRTQLEDGTWFVRSRAFGFQPYFETGFPYGRSQFISTAATAWAALAVADSLER